MTQQQQSREFDVSDLSSIPWLGKGKNEIFDFRSRGKGCLTWSRKSDDLRYFPLVNFSPTCDLFSCHFSNAFTSDTCTS